jgi:hypothetical protein
MPSKPKKPDGLLWGVSVAHPAYPFGPFHSVFLSRPWRDWRFNNFGFSRVDLDPEEPFCPAENAEASSISPSPGDPLLFPCNG